MITKDDILLAQKNWGSAVAASDIDTLLNLYSAQATLKPTLSNDIRTNTEDIRAYFVGSDKFQDKGFLNNGFVKVEFTESNTHLFENYAIDMGKYTFSTKDGEGTSAHFTFTYIEENGELKIRSQHSSLFV